MIPDMIFADLAESFGKPSAEERELLTQQQLALFEADGKQVTLLELAVEGGFLTPAESEKFVKLAKLQDVSDAPRSTKAPTERARTKAPTERARTKAPTERVQTQAPTARVPAQGPGSERRRAPTKGSERRRAPTKGTSERAKGSASERARRGASGRHATGGVGVVIPVLVGVVVFAVAGVAFMANRKTPTVAEVEEEVRDEAYYLEQSKDVRRSSLERLDRGQGEKALANLDARIAEWSQEPEAAKAVLELHDLRRELVTALEEEESPQEEHRLDPVPENGSAGFEIEEEQTEEPPAETADPKQPKPEETENEGGRKVVIVIPKQPRKKPPTQPKPEASEAEPKPDAEESDATTQSRDDLLGDLDALRARGLTAEFQERAQELEPDDADGWMRLAKWSRRNHLYAEERRALRTALKIEPGHRPATRQLDEVLEEEREHANWHTPWREEGSQLFFETNTSEAKLYWYSQAVNAFFARYSKIFRLRRTPLKAWGKKIGVRIFANRDDFLRYQKETGSSTSESAVGYYSLQTKELVLYDDPNDPHESRDTLFHEGTHLFTHLALGEQTYQLPPWILEGIAEYFGASAYDVETDELEIGHPSYARLRAAKRRVKRNQASLRGDLLNCDFGEYGSDNYALGWALIHMLLEKRKPGKKTPIYQKGFLRCFEAVANGEDSAAAFERCVGRIPQLEQEWQEYIRDFPAPPYEEGLAFARNREHDAAIPLFEEHLKANPNDARAAFQLGESCYALDRYEQAIRAYREAIRLNHDFLDAYDGLCFALVAADHAKHAVEAAKDALEREPSGRAYYALAWALHNAGDNQAALEAIRESIALDGAKATRVSLRDDIKRELKKAK